MVCTNLERDCIHLQIHTPNMIYKVHFCHHWSKYLSLFCTKESNAKVCIQKLSQTHFYTFTTPIWLLFAITLSAPKYPWDCHKSLLFYNLSQIFMSQDEFFFSKKTCKMKAGQVTNMIFQRPQVLCRFSFVWKLTTIFHRWFFYVLYFLI